MKNKKKLIKNIYKLWGLIDPIIPIRDNDLIIHKFLTDLDFKAMSKAQLLDIQNYLENYLKKS